MKIKIKKLHPNAVVPTYSHGAHEDAGMDLRSVERVVLRPFEPRVVKTGLAIQLPAGFEAQIRSRSGLAAKHGVAVLNDPGTIDPGYIGEIGVILCWIGHSPCNRFLEGFLVEPGDRIAQMVVARYEPVEWDQNDGFTPTQRDAGGFGSTGIR
jgi:dUTP pyrophosphatase